MNEFDEHTVAPFIMQFCGHMKNNVVGNEEKPFNAHEHGCEMAVFLDGKMKLIRKEFEKQMENNNDDDSNVIGKMVKEMKDRLLDDVEALTKHFLIRFFNNEKKKEKGDTIPVSDVYGRMIAYRSMQKECMDALKAFKEGEEPNFNTAYSMLGAFEEMGQFLAEDINVARDLNWTIQAFEADQLAYKFLLKLEKKHSGHEQPGSSRRD